jgi:hypothetical protein
MIKNRRKNPRKQGKKKLKTSSCCKQETESPKPMIQQLHTICGCASPVLEVDERFKEQKREH